MLYLKVSSSVLIAVALICIIQNAKSLNINPQATEDKWSILENSTNQNDLKKITKLCKVSLNNFIEKLENTKNIANKKLPEPNKTTDDIANLVSEIKTQVKNASADLVSVRKLVQKTALRFRDTFKSLVSFTELDNESVNKELESIQKTKVDNKKPLVNRVIRSFGNRYDLNKLANKVLEISSDRENLKDNYDGKKKIVKKEFNSLWNSLFNHSKTMNDNALNALNTFFEGIQSVKNVKKKIKTLGENALDEIKVGDDIIKLKNAVELAKSLKLKFEDEWSLDSAELTYSEEQKKSSLTDENQSYIQENEQDKSNENVSINDIETELPKTEQKTILNDKPNVIPLTQDETKIMQPKIFETEHNNPMDTNIFDSIDSPVKENSLIIDTKNKDKRKIIQPEVSNKNKNVIDDVDLNSDSSIQVTSFSPDNNNNGELVNPFKDSTNNIRAKRISKRTSREKTLILPWENLIQLNNPWVSQQSMKCRDLLKNVTPDFDDIKKAAKTSIQVTKNYENLQKIENDTIKQFYDKMVDTNMKLCDYLVDAADNVCAIITPINKRYEKKFKNDPNIKRIKYLLGKQYDPNQYILKILDNANHRNGIGGMKKTTYYKMLAVAHNLNHETKEMENAALYAMNKIYEGKLALIDLQKNFNKEKASKACFIRNILIEKENEEDKKNKEENKERVKECMNEDTNTEPLKPEVNLDSVDALQLSAVNEDGETIINNDEGTKTKNENSAENSDPDISSNLENKHNTASLEHSKSEKVDSDEKHITHDESDEEITSVKPEVKHLGKTKNPDDDKDIYEENETSDEEGENNLNQSNDDNFKTLLPKNKETTDEVVENGSDKVFTPKISENNNDDTNNMLEAQPEISMVPKEEDYSNEYGIDDDKKTQSDGKQKYPNNEYNIGESKVPYDDMLHKIPRDLKKATIDDNIDDEEPENITKETVDLDDNENLNSVEGADVKCVKNENILPEADSMGEDSTSVESSNEETEHSFLNESKNIPQRNNSENNSIKSNNIIQNATNNKQEISGESNTEEEHETEPSVVDENIEKTSESPDQEIKYNIDGEQESGTPKNKQSLEQAPEKLSNEEMDEPIDADHPNDGDDQTKTKRRQLRRRKHKQVVQELPEENNTDENQRYGSPEVAEDVENNPEGSDRDTSHYDDGEHESGAPENTQPLEQAPKQLSDEEIDEPIDADHPNDGDDQTKTKRRRLRRRKELPEDNNTDENQRYGSPEVAEDVENNPEGSDRDTSHYDDGEHESGTPENKQSLEQAPEKMSNEEMDEPIDADHPNDGDDQTKTKRRRLRRRKDKEHDQESPEDNNTDENQRYGSPEVAEDVENNPEGSDRDTSHYDDGEHESEAPENTQSLEQAPIQLSDEEIDEPIDADHPNDGDDQTKTKRRRLRRRKDNEHNQESPEDNNTDENQGYGSPEVAEEVENNPEGSDRDTSHYDDGEHESEAPENTQSLEQAPIQLSDEEIDEPIDADHPNDGDDQTKTKRRRLRRRKELPEDNNTDENQRYGSPEVAEDVENNPEGSDRDTSHYDDGEQESGAPENTQPLEQAPKQLSDEEIDEPIDADHPNDSDDQTKAKRRRLRRRKDKEHDQESPEDNNTDENQRYGSPEVAEDVENNPEGSDRDTSHYDDGEHESGAPENTQPLEQAPKQLSDEEIDEPIDADHPNDGDDQTKTKRRRLRRRKELPEDNNTDENQRYGSPEVAEDVENNPEGSDRDTSHYDDGEHESGTPENKQSLEQAPEKMSNEEMDEPIDADHPNDGDDQTKTKRRRLRRRKDKEHDQESPEDNNTDENQRYGSPEVAEDVENNPEGSDRDTSHYDDGEHESEAPENTQSLEQAPIQLSDEEIDEPIDADHPNDGDDQTKTKRRRLRRRKDKEHDQESPEDNNTDENQRYGSPEVAEDVENNPEGSDRDTSHYDDGEQESGAPENTQPLEQAPKQLSDEEIDEPIDADHPNDSDDQTKAKRRRLRRRKDKEHDQESPEDNNTDENQRYGSPEVAEDVENNPEGSDRDTSHYDDGEQESGAPENTQPLEQAPKQLSDEEIDEPIDADHPNDSDDQTKAKRRRLRRRKDKEHDQESPEDNNTDENQRYGSPEVAEDVENNPEGSDRDTSHYDDGEHESEAPENTQSLEQAPKQLSDEEIDEPIDADHPNDGDDQTKTKRRRLRRRKDKEHDQESPEDNNTDENQGYGSPEVAENVDYNPECPDEDKSYYTDPAPPEYSQSLEQSPERISNEEMDDVNDSEQPNDGDKRLTIKRRLYRRRKDMEDDQESPEDNNTDENQRYGSPEVAEDVENNPEGSDRDTSHYDDGEHESGAPENTQSLEQAPIQLSDEEIDEPIDADHPNDGDDQTKTKRRRLRRRKELPEDNNTDENQRYGSPEVAEDVENNPEGSDRDTSHYDDGEQESGAPENTQPLEQAPKQLSDEEIDEPIDADHPNDSDDQTKAKRRRLRRRKDKEHDQESPEDNNTDENQRYGSPEVAEDVENNPEGSDRDTSHYDDGEQESGAPENTQPLEQAPKQLSDEEIDEPIDADHPNDSDDQTKAKRRRLRRRKDKEHDQESPEDNNTDENQRYGSPEVAEDVENNPEGSDRDTSHYDDGEHESEAPENTQSLEQAPKQLSDEEIDEPIDADHPNDGDDQTKTKRRRLRRRKDKEHDQESPEDNNTDENQGYGSPEVAENVDYNPECPDEDKSYYTDPAPPEYSQSLEQSPERISNEEMDDVNDSEQPNDGDKRLTIKRRLYRRRKDMEDDQESPEENNTDENQEYGSPEVAENVDYNPEFSDEDKSYYTDPAPPEYSQSLEQSPERISNEEMDDVNDSEQPNDGDKRLTIKRRLYRRRKDMEDDQESPEENNTDENQGYGSPEVAENVDYNPECPDEDKSYYTDPAPPKCNQSLEQSPERITNEEMDDLNDSEQPNDGDKRPTIKRRLYRRRKDMDDDQESPEDNNTDENQRYGSPEVAEDVENNPEGSDRDTSHYDDGEHESEAPENSQSLEQAPIQLSDEEIDEPIDADYPNDGDDQTKTKIRRLRRRKDKEHDQESPEDNNTDENQRYGSPEVDENVENNSECPNEDKTYYTDPAPPEYNQSLEQAPERMSNEEMDEPEDKNFGISDKNKEHEHPEFSESSENSVVTPDSSSVNDFDETINGEDLRPYNVRRRRKLRHPKTIYENYNEPEVVYDRNIANFPIDNKYSNNNNIPYNNKNNVNRYDIYGTRNPQLTRRKRLFTTNKNPTVDNITPYSSDELGRIQNDEKFVRRGQNKNARRNQKKKKHLRRIITYRVNKATNERIKVNEQTFTTINGLPHTPKNKLQSIKTEYSNDPITNKDNNDYSSFLFKEYNTDQCKRDAYDNLKKVHSQNAKEIAYRSILDTNEMRSNILATVKNAIGNVKASKTLNDVDQSLRTVSYSLKTVLKQTVHDLVTKVIPLANDFLETAENLRYIYKNGPQTTYKMLSDILNNESTIPDSAKDVLKLISPQLDVDKLINNILEKPCNTKALKEKKVKAQRKLIDLSKHMDTAICNIDCWVLSAMSTVGIGADTLKLLKSGRVIMSEKHPKAKALRDAVGIIKSGQKVINNDRGFISKLTPFDGTAKSDKYNDYENPDEVAQKNEDILKTVPHLKDNMTLPKNFSKKRHPLGVIVVHPNNDIDYKEVTNTSQLRKFVGDQSKKYKSQYKNNHPTFLKLNNNKLFYSMVADVKKKAETNRMSKK